MKESTSSKVSGGIALFFMQAVPDAIPGISRFASQAHPGSQLRQLLQIVDQPGAPTSICPLTTTTPPSNPNEFEDSSAKGAGMP